MDGFERDGLRFRVRDGGPADGDLVVLLHGFPQDSTCWREVEPLLHAGGCRTLAPDQRGYSPQARPRHTGAYAVRVASQPGHPGFDVDARTALGERIARQGCSVDEVDEVVARVLQSAAPERDGS